MSRVPVERVLGVRIRGPVAIAGYAWGRTRECVYLLKGKNVLCRSSAHYRRARREFRRAHPEAASATRSIRDVGVLVIRPEDRSAAVSLSPAHANVVARVAAAADRALASSANCRFVPTVRSTPIPERTEAVSEVMNREVIVIQLQDPLTQDGLQDLCEPLMDELERKLYRSFTLVDKVYTSIEAPSATRRRARPGSGTTTTIRERC